MGQPQDRKWTVDLRARAEDGEFFYDEDYAAQKTVEAYMDLATIQHREGGAFVVAPIRTQIPAAPEALMPDPVWVNMGLVVEHKFVPPVKARPVPAQYDNGHAQQAATSPSVNPFGQEQAASAGDRDDEMRDEDEATAAAELEEGDEPSAVMAQPSSPTAQPAPLDPARLMPEMH